MVNCNLIIISILSFADSFVYQLGHRFFIFLFYRFFSQQVRVGGRNKNKNKIHSDHFPIELKSKETLIEYSDGLLTKFLLLSSSFHCFYESINTFQILCQAHTGFELLNLYFFSSPELSGS